MSRLKEFEIVPETELVVIFDGKYAGYIAMIKSESINQRWAYKKHRWPHGEWQAYHGNKKVKMRCKDDAVAALLADYLAQKVEVYKHGWDRAGL